MPRAVKDRFTLEATRVPELMAEIMQNRAEKTADRIRAAEVILDRAYGKAVQQTDANVNFTTSLVSILAGIGAGEDTDVADQSDELH